ncbi:M14 family metallocarboxypeptidase [Shewanella marinintestina]|uniref:M14 family metallopeptidase n=1 Tax=Shewanella marinintestina TaxID=190305 RepID=UPI00200BC2DB|nr:M14 family metallocarboxypeptidase [Shewanella marinintestina]MCL1146683.1 M14 family metallocarboxypeptidase [Shewanella marinintestina]
MDQQVYAIGVKGQKWGDAEKAQWINVQSIKRSYQDEVLVKVQALKDLFDVEQYGALSYDVERYPLLAVKSKNWDANKATILVTGGVHGYETSGVQGAIRFAETKAADYAKHFNILVAPCISPWGYETINRWNPKAIDPNRSFYADSPAEESAALIKLLADLDVEIFAHIDLHETTDTDNSEFRPALSARDAVEHTNWNIPDGFYLVGDTIHPQDEFQTAIIKSVEQVTHIAPADDDGKLIGVDLAQFGVINYATKALGLCAGVTDAKYVTTTEVYPDSPLSDDENCIVAQVAAITGGLDYLLSL